LRKDAILAVKLPRVQFEVWTTIPATQALVKL
jgi:hypothetical protein